jgi:hypothetical protein
MIHYRNLAILNKKWDLAPDAFPEGEAAREGSAATQAKKVSVLRFPLLGDTAQTGLQLGEKPTPVIERKLLRQTETVCPMY